MPVSEIDYSRISFPEALDYLSEKTNLDTDTYIEGQGIVQDVAFTVAAAKGQLLQDIRDAMDRSISNGESVDKFLVRFNNIAASYTDDWPLKGGNSWRGALIYQQNIRQAYNAGRYAQMTDPDVMKLRPYWQWRHGDSDAPRLTHLALDRKVFRADSLPFHPPMGFNCFPAGTLVATANGWKAIETIQRGDSVLGGSGNFQSCLFRHETFFDGKLVEIGIDNSRFSATPNHRFLTHRGWIDAANLKLGDVLVQIPQIAMIDEIVGDVDNLDPLFSQGCVAQPVNPSVTADALDSKRDAINFDVDPVRADIKIKTASSTSFSQEFNRSLLPSSWQRIVIQVGRRIFPKLFNSRFVTFLPYNWIEQRGRSFEFFRSSPSTFVSVFRLTKSRVIDSSLPIGNLLHVLTGQRPLSWIPEILPSSSHAPRNFETIPIKQSHDCPNVALPSLGESLYRQQLLIEEEINNLDYGAPLHFFDSLDSFVRWSASHCILSEVVNLSQTLYTGNVYNLSVREDESYCLSNSVVHNCACSVFSLSQRDVDRKGLEIEELSIGQDLEVVDPSNGVKRTVKLQPDKGFDRIPGKSTPEQRARLLDRLDPSLRERVVQESGVDVE